MSYGYSGAALETVNQRQGQTNGGVVKGLSAASAPAFLVDPFPPREEGPSQASRVQRLESIVEEQAGQIQTLADAVRQLRSILGC